MRPPRLLLLVFCLIFFPIFLSIYSVLTSSPRVATPSSFAGRATGLHALLSFNIPASLFPPSAIISLTDDNSTFFLARPAAFGPLLSGSGLSGQLWVGSGFGDKTALGAEGELGCSDIPGWEEGGDSAQRRVTPQVPPDSAFAHAISGVGKDSAVSSIHRRSDSPQDTDPQQHAEDSLTPSSKDGTDDYLHHPLADSTAMGPGASGKYAKYTNRQTTHADIQSLQESAEIDGKVVLLSRGGCGFLEKVKWAQRRGGVALIVGDDTRGGSLVTMYARGDTSNVTIPSLFTSHTTAHLLSSLAQAEESSTSDRSRVPLSKNPSQNGGSGRQPTTTTTSTVASPTATQNALEDEAPTSAERNEGLLHALLSTLGFGNDAGRPWLAAKDSRRPPTSGNINWIPRDVLEDQDSSRTGAAKAAGQTKGSRASKDHSKRYETESASSDGDGFIIGVQDWRDPDLVAPKSNSPANGAAEPGNKLQKGEQDSHPTSASLKGGSITPGSGEYRIMDKSKLDKAADTERSSSRNLLLEDSSPGWFSRHFRWSKGNAFEVARSPQSHSSRAGSTGGDPSEHEGLWVTLMPANMSASPFFDTLLVLVVSPLLTLTVVYALLLLRSRIRRRRWRAPKSLVERLPVRTYHTISTSSSSATSTPRATSPGPLTSTSPLLGHRNTSGSMRSRARSPPPGAVSSSQGAMQGSTRREKADSSSLWRRKYTGRQVECVVCLEEYVDGQSRVMSLPCGHEFHAECITPWLTTRRRTCPICKGDVVRSMSQNQPSHPRDTTEPVTDEEILHSSSSAPMPIITAASEEGYSDPEAPHVSDAGRLEEQASSAPQPGWRNLAALSFSALSGDTIWHQSRYDSSR
ncbi:hypothetical protein P168DRAFT_232120 [Aspergillus campestris IBT 28561]|uniref:RING-type E3 ubiquitin transferase n=1 Tax=Aspergillus campestris (strain IBT 28561) TaxID=1392248 RepID=A0A2I1D9L5_ASPC2|nr:uncharacterized protein P168DRAFT_232120 [Aspergillus campestris IBT 28561]PKY06565.1 hypothetical protein P168DRAFT_232120 [Aspergillus campestris IBT 28561]